MTPVPSTPAAQSAVRYRGLDGLRAFAVIGVAVYHLFPGVLPGGFIGVDVFFVISGFLITSLLVEERSGTGRIALGSFWRRRARRLLPALAILLLVCSGLAYLIGGDVLVGLPRQLIGAATFSYNWTAIADGSDYFGSTPELFRNLWSLAVEEQFYLLWPLALLLLMLIPLRKVRVLILVVVAVASAAAMGLLASTGQDATRVYFGSDTHLFGLALGAALGIAMSGRPPGTPLRSLAGRIAAPVAGLVAAAAVGYAAVVLRDDDLLTYRGGLFAVSAATAVVIWAAVRTRWLGTVLDVAPLRWVGIRSYGLYLWHWPLFVLLGGATRRYGLELDPWVTGTVCAVLTVLAATLSFALVERPIRRHGFVPTARRVGSALRRSGRSRAVAVAVTAVTALSIAGTVLAIQAAPSSSAAQRYVAAGQAALEEADAAPESVASRPAPPLASAVNHLPGAPKGPPHIQYPTGDQITAIGDSVMLASAKALQDRFPGIAVDAAVSRSISSAPAMVQAQVDAGTLRPIVILALGTNGPITSATLEQVLQIIGPARQLVVLSVQAPRSWIPPNNAVIRSFTAAHPRDVTLTDWEAAIAPHLQLLASDRIHPGPSGAAVYAETLASALGQVVERQQRVADAEYAAKVAVGKQRTRVIQLLALPPCPLPGVGGGILCA